MKRTKLFSMMLALLMVLGTFSVTMSAEEAAQESVLPSKIMDEATYATKTIVNFEEENLESSISSNGDGRCTFAIKDDIGVQGKALELKSANNTGEVYIKLKEVDISLYDGVMYYIDISGVQLNEGKTTSGAGIRFQSPFYSGLSWTRNDQDPIVEGHEIKAYYLVGDEWKLCDVNLMNGERVQFPENFKGWVYIPFSSYVSTKVQGTNRAGVYGAEAITKIMLLTGPYVVSDKENPGVVIFDEIQVVKLGMTNEQMAELEASQNPDDNGDDNGDDNNGENNQENPGNADNNNQSGSNNNTQQNGSKDTDKTNNTTESDTSKAEKDKGCGSAISFTSAVMTVSVVFAGGMIIRKKKHEDQ